MGVRPRLLDLFCGAGGAAMGYHEAGFDVVGVDIKPQPNYPFEFIRADVMSSDTLRWDGWDTIHASPPCQAYSRLRHLPWLKDREYPDLLGPTRDLLRATGKPWVIENVPGARTPMSPDLVLCGSQFGLKVRRHRWFEMHPKPALALMQPCSHDDLLPFEHKGERAYADAMGCTWMTGVEARQAIPPSFTRYIGEQLMQFLHATNRDASRAVPATAGVSPPWMSPTTE